MRKTRKRIVSLFAAAVLAASLIACSSGSTGAAAGSAAEDSKTAAAAAPAGAGTEETDAAEAAAVEATEAEAVADAGAAAATAAVAGSTAAEQTADPAVTGEKPTASATLRLEDDREVDVTVDLSGNCSAHFARGAVYFYQSGVTLSEYDDAAAYAYVIGRQEYEEHLADLKGYDSFEETAAYVRGQEEGGSYRYLAPLGQDIYLMIVAAGEPDPDAIFARFTAEPEENFFTEELKLDFGSSELFSPEELEAAAGYITSEIGSWEGCELHSLRYAGDMSNTEENIQWLNSLSNGMGYTKVAEFLCNFHSPVEGGGAWEPDTEYEDYQFWLGRTQEGGWDIVTYGY